jgi:site-specific DNA-methyltransferase (adenine-specific)
MNQILQGDCLDLLPFVPEESCSLALIDPPFNTGVTQFRERKVWTQDEGQSSYADRFENYEDFLIPRIKASLHALTKNGSLFVWLDWREVHYIKVALDKLIGRKNFVQEIIWHWDYGARSRRLWSRKSNTILWYAKDPSAYIFRYEDSDRIPYMAPDMQTPERAKLGKTPTNVWFHTIVPTNSKEKTGYPSQKPIGVVNRIVKVHSNPGDTVLDFFAGSGTTGMSAVKLGRKFILIDQSETAVSLMKQRLAGLF